MRIRILRWNPETEVFIGPPVADQFAELIKAKPPRDAGPTIFKRLAPLLAGASVFSVITALMWPDLGINMIADSLALWFGLFVVDRALDQDKNERLEPAKRAAIREAGYIYGLLCHLFNMAIECIAAVPTLPELEWCVRYGQYTSLGALMGRVNLDHTTAWNEKGVDGVGEYLTWREFIEARVELVQQAIDRFMVRYPTVAEPDLIEAVQRLETCAYLQIVKRSKVLDDLPAIPTPVWEILLERAAELRAAAIRMNGGTDSRDISPVPIITSETFSGIRRGVLPYREDRAAGSDTPPARQIYRFGARVPGIAWPPGVSMSPRGPRTDHVLANQRGAPAALRAHFIGYTD